MKKGKRELFIEALGEQFTLTQFKKLLEDNLKEAGIKYSDNSKMYFNVAEKTVYCVSDDGKQVNISLIK
jgi:hypothetical protein